MNGCALAISTSPDDWLPLEEAAVLLGESPRTLRWRARSTLAARGLACLAAPRATRGKPIWWINRRADARLARNLTPQTRDERTRESLLTRYPEHLVQRAYRRAHWLHEWRRRCANERSSGSAFRIHNSAFRTGLQIAADVVAQAHRVEGDSFKISARSLQAWHKAWNTVGPDGQVAGLEALVDQYRSPCGVGTVHHCSRSPEAVDYFYRLYRSPGQNTVRTCHRVTLAKARAENWQWPASYAATARWVADQSDLATDCLHRDGRGAYSHKHMPHLKLDYTTIEPGERYVCDHTQVDFWIRSPISDGQLRPWLTAVLDCRSRCVVGWHLGISPNQDAILAAFRMAFLDWSIPARVHMDRGADFTSKLILGFTKREAAEHRRELGPDWKDTLAARTDQFFAGVFGELGIDVSEALPRHPWAKGQVERWYRTFEDQCAKTFTTYCGRSSAHKPECLPAMRAADDVPTLDEARRRVGVWIDLYHRTAHAGDGMEGLTPLAVWATATHVRKAVESELLAMMQARGVYRVGPNGVTFKIAGTTLTYGGTSGKLRRLRGRDVFITLDPQRSGCCFSYTMGPPRKFIDQLLCNERIPVDTPMENLRAAIRALRSRNKDFDRAQRSAPQRMRSAAQELAAMQVQEHKRLLATGTDDARPDPDIIPVRTSFQAVSTPVQYRDREGAAFLPNAGDSQAADALRRLAEFGRRPETSTAPASAWSRLVAFTKGGNSD